MKFGLLLVFWMLWSSPCVQAADVQADDQDFAQSVDAVKDPFDDGLPKPVAPAPVMPRPPAPPVPVVPRPVFNVRPQVRPPQVVLPALHVNGVIVGEEVHQAIINDKVVPLSGTIMGARVDAVTKNGVEVTFQGKKFFLKVD